MSPSAQRVESVGYSYFYQLHNTVVCATSTATLFSALLHNTAICTTSTATLCSVLLSKSTTVIQFRQKRYASYTDWERRQLTATVSVQTTSASTLPSCAWYYFGSVHSLYFCFLFYFWPIHSLSPPLLFPFSFLVVTQSDPGSQSCGLFSLLPSPLRCLPRKEKLSRQDFSTFFPRRLASNCTYHTHAAAGGCSQHFIPF